jgi:hypothetical protein
MSDINKMHTRLKTARIAAGYRTATEFCEKNHIPISTYNMHETGKRKIMSTVAEKYSELLKINTAWLIMGIGTPYTDSDLKESTELTENEYLSLLNYKGNSKLQHHQAINHTDLQQIDPTLFCKITIDIIQLLKEHGIKPDLQLITHHAIEMYQDITQTTKSHKEQLSMVNLAITIFKRQLQEQNKH